MKQVFLNCINTINYLILFQLYQSKIRVSSTLYLNPIPQINTPGPDDSPMKPKRPDRPEIGPKRPGFFQYTGLSHPFLGMGRGPLELGKIASF